MKQQDQRVDPLREVVRLQAGDGLVDGVTTQHVVDVGFYAGFHQHPDRSQGVVIAVPADRHRAAVFPAHADVVRGEAVTGGSKVGHDVVRAAQLEDVLDVLVLVRVAAATQRELVDPVTALRSDGRKIIQQHVGLGDGQAALVAADAGFDAQTSLAVDAVAHDADIDQVREGGPEGVHAGIPALLIEDTGAHIRPCLRIEHCDEVVLFVNDLLIHSG